MPGISKDIHFVWIGTKFDKFEKDRFKHCHEINKDYTIHLWVDAYSMMGPETALPIAKYHTNTAMAKLLDEAAAKVYGGHHEGTDLRKVAPLSEALAEIRASHIAFEEHFKTHREAVLAKAHEAFHKFHELCVPPDKVKLHFLEDEYPEWRKLHNVGELVDLIAFERLARKGNFGAASDIARLLVLHTHGGIYSDHDTEFRTPFGNPPPGEFWYAVTTSGRPVGITNALIACQAKHGLLIQACETILEAYHGHFKTSASLKDYYTAARPVKKEGVKDEDLPTSPFEEKTLNTTGPSVFRNSIWVHYKSDDTEIGKHRWERDALRKFVEIHSKKAWALADL